ncbi:hypothetical protein NQZ68_012628 [Dissostichus eleginoides]|nr:hypothetical protein NQZ68_012628 [Dissostichus eleginoides]
MLGLASMQKSWEGYVFLTAVCRGGGLQAALTAIFPESSDGAAAPVAWLNIPLLPTGYKSLRGKCAAIPCHIQLAARVVMLGGRAGGVHGR